jgi:magnesium-transporting ATPase (P-type)
MPLPGTSTDPSTCEVEAVAAELRVDIERGLTGTEAARRLAADGPNELRSTPPRPAWQRLLAQFRDPLVYLLLAAVGIAAAAWLVEGRHGWPVDAIVILLVVVLNAVLGFVQEAKAADAVAALARMTAANSSVLRDGQVLRIPSDEVVRGDVLILAEGDAVGADARLVRAADLRIQEASLTGESEAVLKDAGQLAGAAPLGDRFNMVFRGTAVAQGTGRAVVTATAMDTEMGAIAEMLESTPEAPTPLQKEVAQIGRMLGIAVVVIALIVVASILLLSDVRTTSGFITVLLLGVSLAVAAVPEGLPAILSVVLALGVQRMARRHAIVKKLSSVETLGSASVICSDKTGTLTRSEMTIERVVTASGDSRITGIGYAPEGRVEQRGQPLEAGPVHAEHIVVLSGGSLASNADLRQRADGGWEIQGDPTEAAFSRGRAQARRQRSTRAPLRAGRRDSVQLRSQDDVLDRTRPRAGRCAGRRHQGRA